MDVHLKIANMLRFDRCLKSKIQEKEKRGGYEEKTRRVHYLGNFSIRALLLGHDRAVSGLMTAWGQHEDGIMTA